MCYRYKVGKYTGEKSSEDDSILDTQLENTNEAIPSENSGRYSIVEEVDRLLYLLESKSNKPEKMLMEASNLEIKKKYSLSITEVTNQREPNFHAEEKYELVETKSKKVLIVGHTKPFELIRKVKLNSKKIDTYLYTGEVKRYYFRLGETGTSVSKKYLELSKESVEEYLRLIKKYKKSLDYTESLENKKDTVILDVGAGKNGALEEIKKKLSNITTVGISLDPYKKDTGDIKIGYENYLVANAEDLELSPVVRQSYDLIISQFTFCHFLDPLGALVNFYSLLKQGGRMIIDRIPLVGLDKKCVEKLKKYLEYNYQATVFIFSKVDSEISTNGNSDSDDDSEFYNSDGDYLGAFEYFEIFIDLKKFKVDMSLPVSYTRKFMFNKIKYVM